MHRYRPKAKHAIFNVSEFVIMRIYGTANSSIVKNCILKNNTYLLSVNIYFIILSTYYHPSGEQRGWHCVSFSLRPHFPRSCRSFVEFHPPRKQTSQDNQ